ncbi:hypothetical protein RC74_17130 [Falsihalocynthiibacter arcticus]|uniref:Integrase n=1 Tax=Falsihalocynthiibacter arcticus TaxID=1579316 RepID=A0A126V388_9RHOB|nr:hypothetical protein RC74_17130 [Falsihalocynthiibacter arcticus]
MTVKYVTQDKKSGSYIYRRRVPKALVGLIKKNEFLKVIGKTSGEAMTNYGMVHQRFEHLLSLSRNGVTNLSPMEQSKPMVALLSEWGWTHMEWEETKTREQQGMLLFQSWWISIKTPIQVNI